MMHIVAEIWTEIQKHLLPDLRECLQDPLTEKLQQLICILEVLRIEDNVRHRNLQWMGRKRLDRRFIARAFVAKAVYNLPTTTLLIEMLESQPSLRRICGWERRRDIPSASTFSRAFAEFAEDGVGDQRLLTLVEEHIGEQMVLHISRDSTEIEAREKPAKKPKKEPAPKRPRGRPKKGDVREPPPLPRIQKQMTQTAEEALQELPKVCDVGTKLDTKGHLHSWIGWSTHIDWSDGGLPLNAVTTSASMHDSQAAIPMGKQTSERVISCYDLMDSAYDADLIHQGCRNLGHVPIIDIHGRRKHTPPFDPATARRYQQRTTAERGNSRLKDEFGGRHLRVRGHPKAHLHVMFGLLALFADQLFKLFAS